MEKLNNFILLDCFYVIGTYFPRGYAKKILPVCSYKLMAHIPDEDGN